jgi:hypothetical protein
MTNSMNIVSAEKSANGGRVLADANLGFGEKFLAQKQDNLIRALETLKAAIVSEDKESIFKAAIQMEESREMAASYSGFLDNMLNVECSQAMVNALIKLIMDLIDCISEQV